MANIAVQRIKREFKEVLKSEEVRNELPDTPMSARGGRALPSATPAAPAAPAGLAAAAAADGEAAVSPPPPAAFPSPPRALV